MFNLNAIAKHLKTTTTAIVRVEEWANCLFVVAKGIGGRFVSKKVGITLELSPKFQVGETYTSNESNSVTFKVTKRTACFVTVQFFLDGQEDPWFKGSGRRKVLTINGKEYFDSGMYSCYAA